MQFSREDLISRARVLRDKDSLRQTGQALHANRYDAMAIHATFRRGRETWQFRHSEPEKLGC